MSARTRPKTRHAAIILSILLGLVAQFSQADAIADAERLLRVSETERHFQFAARKQTSDLLRVYSGIVAQSANVELPWHITREIETCYQHAYAWDRFSSGIAEILAQHFTSSELQQLTDFYRNRGLSPLDIGNFKLAIAKARGIEEQTAKFMFNSSSGCVEQASKLIRRYVNSLPLAADDRAGDSTTFDINNRHPRENSSTP